MPRALWAKAPLALLRHRTVLFAVVTASMLVAVAGASVPLLRAGVESEALKSRIDELTPLGAGLTIETQLHRDRGDLRGSDRARRAAARQLARALPFVGRPIMTTTGVAQVGGAALEGANQLLVIPMARTAATDHVTRVSGEGGHAWVAAPVARLARIRAGQAITLVSPALPGVNAKSIHLPVSAVYRSLDADRDNPYWVDFTARIRPVSADASPLPTFLLVQQAELYRIAHAVGGDELASTFEFPVRARAMTPARAKEAARRFAEIRRSLNGPTRLAAALGCERPYRCSVTSSLEAAVALAERSVGALTPVISLLGGFAALIAVGAAFIAGAFGVRRRAPEARLSVVAGEARSTFAVRAGIEALLPALLGAAIGFGIAVTLALTFTPDGTIDSGVLAAALAATVLAALGSVVAVAVGACAARGPTAARARSGFRVSRLPWELPVLIAAGIDFAAIQQGGGLVADEAIGSHPRLVVLLLPLLLAAGLAGLGTRGLRQALRGRSARSDAIYLAIRRLAAARAMLVLLIVTAAASVGALCFAEVLDSSLSSNSAEKAYVANGADVQGLIDAGQTFPPNFPYPIAKVRQSLDTVRIDSVRIESMSTGSGSPIEVLEVDPVALGHVVRWRWGGDPLGALAKLAASDSTLPVVANAAARQATVISIGASRIRVRVVATVDVFPGSIAGQPLLVVPAIKFERAADLAGVMGDPLDHATAYVWARGDPTDVARALTDSAIAPLYITTVDHFLQSAELTTAARTYGFLRVVALGAALVSLVALLLYLQARGRSQLVTSAFLARMGMSAWRRAASVALEAAALVAFAVVAGAGSALLVAAPLVSRVDPLPQYAPGASIVVPWTLLVISTCTLVAAGAAAGAAASALAGRAEVGEELRVA